MSKNKKTEVPAPAPVEPAPTKIAPKRMEDMDIAECIEGITIDSNDVITPAVVFTISNARIYRFEELFKGTYKVLIRLPKGHPAYNNMVEFDKVMAAGHELGPKLHRIYTSTLVSEKDESLFIYAKVAGDVPVEIFNTDKSGARKVVKKVQLKDIVANIISGQGSALFSVKSFWRNNKHGEIALGLSLDVEFIGFEQLEINETKKAARSFSFL